jgi:hypothetical protein
MYRNSNICIWQRVETVILNFGCKVFSIFYVTDGNIMYLPDASRFLISCVIQHYAPVEGWGGVEEQMHNVDYDPGP